MRKIYIILLVFFLLFQIKDIIQAQEIDKQEIEQINILSSTFHQYNYPLREQIWPGFHPLSYPAVFHFKNGHLYAFGFKGPLAAWRTYPSHLSHVLTRHEAKSALLEVPMNPAYLIEGQPAFVFGLNAEEKHPYLLIQTFIHERFHVFQFQNFTPEKINEAVIADYEKTFQLTCIAVENHLLTQALNAQFIEEQQHFIKDFLAINQMRRKLLSVESKKWEDHQQKMEGLAEYVSLKTFHLFSSILDFDFVSMVLNLREKKLNGNVGLIQDAMKGRHYFVGAVIGWILDQQPKLNWKYSIQTGRLTLIELLERAYPMSLREMEERLARLKNQEEWQTCQETIQLQYEKEKANEQVAVKLFEEQPGLTIWLGFPPCKTYTGGHHDQMTQVDRLKVLIGDTSYSMSYNKSWMLRFKNIPICLEETTGERTFKLPSQIEFIVDGQQISFQRMQQLPQPIVFSTLSWKDSVCDFETVHKGKIFFESGKLYISFVQ